MLNCIILQGRLTKDPELRYIPSGKAKCSFALAVKRDYKAADGSYQTDYIDCVAWGKTAEIVSQWSTKGKMVIARGRLEGHDWEDKNGNKRRTWEVNCDSVNFVDSKKDDHKTENPANISNDDFSEYGGDDVPF